MTKRAQTWLLIAIALLLLAGFAELMRMRFSRGDVFPVYSSYRADPLGTRALYESLELLPGVRVQRWLRATEKIPDTPRGALVFAGMDYEEWQQMDATDAAKLDELAAKGARVIVAFTAGFEERELKRARAVIDSDDDDGKFDLLAPLPGAVHAAKKTKNKNKTPFDPPKDKRHMPLDAGEQWGAKIHSRRLERDAKGNLSFAIRGTNVSTALPEKLVWLSELYFDTEPSGGWRTLYMREGKAVLIERQLGAGSIVMASDSFFLSNEALQRARSTPLIVWLLAAPNLSGPVIFDEYHLGVKEETGVAALARRYGLGGAACVAMLLVGLWVWRRMALFVPPASESEQAETGYEPTAGLEALLRRSVPKEQIAPLCVAEWKKSASSADITRIDAALAALDKNATQENIYLTARQALKKR